MRTQLAREMGLEFPIFAFSHCRDVVAAVSRAGGMGVLGALYFTPDELEIELDWIDEHVDGKPYGVDLVMPAKVAAARRRRRREPRAHARGDDHAGAPRLGREGARRARRAAAARRRRARPPPARLDRRDRAPAARRRVAALAVAARERARPAAQGHRRHRARARHQGRRAREQPAARAEARQHRRRHRRRAGHRGRRSHR